MCMIAGCTVTDGYPWYDRVNFMEALYKCNSEFHSHMPVFSSSRKCSPVLSTQAGFILPFPTCLGWWGQLLSWAVASQGGGFTGNPVGSAVV